MGQVSYNPATLSLTIRPGIMNEGIITQLASVENLAEVFLEAMRTGIHDQCNIIDPDYRIVWHNRVAGDPREIGTPCHEVYQKRNEPCTLCPVRIVFTTGKPCVLERERYDRLPNGLHRWGEIRAYPISGESSQVEHVLTIGFDITDRKLGLEKERKYVHSLEKRLQEISRENLAEEPPSRGKPSGLTGREREVLYLIARGLSNVEISKVLSLSPHTVKSHVIHIFNKLGVNDRTEAAILASKLKLI